MRLSVGIIPTDNISSLPIDGYNTSASVTSNPISLKHVYGFSVTASWTGAGTGTFTLQGCNDIETPTDYALTYPGLTNWVTLPDSFATSVGSPVMWNYPNTMYRFVRIVFTISGGTIVLTERIQIKAGQ
jgi:hypothetical protein